MMGGMGGGGLGEAGAALGGALGGWIGNNNARNNRGDIDGELAYLARLYDPTSGIMNPIVQAGYESTVDVGPSALEGMQAQLDPVARQQQMRALRGLMEAGQQGGMDPQSRLALAQAEQRAAQQQRATQGLMRQEFAQRGMSGGGTELALRAQAAQGAANTNAMAGMQAAADARQRQLLALAQGGAMAGQVRGQDYGQAADLAGARDRIAEANARNRQSVQGRNIDRRYNAQQQTFANRMGMANGRAGVGRMSIDWNQDEAARKVTQGAATGSAIGRTAGEVVGMIAGGM